MNAYNAKAEQKNQYFGYEFIILGTIERIKKYFTDKDIEVDEKTYEQIYEFLSCLVDGKVWVNFESNLPEKNKYSRCDIDSEPYIIHLAYSTNYDDHFGNTLYVYVDVDYEKKFKMFCAKRYLPENIVEESIKYLDLTRNVVVHVFEHTYNWKSALANAKKPIIIGQDVNSKDFKTFKPVGFVDGNHLTLTSPNDRNDAVGVTYNYN